jgi:hypothetical protein
MPYSLGYVAVKLKGSGNFGVAKRMLLAKLQKSDNHIPVSDWNIIAFARAETLDGKKGAEKYRMEIIDIFSGVLQFFSERRYCKRRGHNIYQYGSKSDDQILLGVFMGNPWKPSVESALSVSMKSQRRQAVEMFQLT